jgi:methylglyoxal synthase
MARTTLALIAHDAKKEDLVQLLHLHREELVGIDLVATRDTGELVEKRLGLRVSLVQRGHLGGDQQIGSLVTSGLIQAVIFLRDPLMSQPHEPEVTPLLRVCDIHNVPLATNLATAEAVLGTVIDHAEVLIEPKLQAKLANEYTLLNVA